jgi:2',3'-cyclic-nucleotide 2'-phosphodiesterase (5'-nucleotidase family)
VRRLGSNLTGKTGSIKKAAAILLSLLMFVTTAAVAVGCAGKTEAGATTDSVEKTESTTDAATETESDTDVEAQASDSSEAEADAQAAKDEIYILFTSDVHCGVDQGFGYAGLAQLRDKLEKDGYETILVDDGDSIQGEVIGTISKGEKIINLMNELGYDVAIPGNHEFDYGMERFFELTEMADFPYISCNFTHKDELVFKPYVIKEAAGLKIAFVGVTTPTTPTTSTPRYFKDEKGEYIYGFMQDKTGEKLYSAVQEAVDAARAEGADLVYVMAHLGNEADCEPWTYADVIANTTGIDVVLDGHSHDSDKVVMKNKDGEDVTRVAVGTKLAGIGYSHILADGTIDDTGAWNWNNNISATELLAIDNEIGTKVDEALKEVSEGMNEVVASTATDLMMDDPNKVDSNGRALRIVRLTETNLGDLVADAYRDQSGADIAFVNGGGIRVGIKKGDITYGDIIGVHPFGNMLCVIEVTGQQILDALEWGSKEVPEENGGFIQVSGLTYEIDSSIDSPCIEDENSMYVGIKGKRRVDNVKVGDEPLDPNKKYTLAGHNYMLLENGDGYTMFDGAPILQDCVKSDNQVLIDYITESLGGEVGEDYSDIYGQGRIKIKE